VKVPIAAKAACGGTRPRTRRTQNTTYTIHTTVNPHLYARFESCRGPRPVSHGTDARIVFPAHRVWYDEDVMMDKKVERMAQKGDQAAEQRIDPHRALEEIWPLSLRLFSLSGQYDVQSGLQRSAETIHRK